MERKHHSERKRRRKGRSIYGERRVIDELPHVRYLHFGDCIGEGHFSHVYEGTYHSNTDVAIKVIERGSEKLVSTEIDILQTLRGSPHVVQLLEVIEKDTTLLIFELLKGIDIENVWEHFTVDRIRFMVKCILEALDAAHSNNIVHRDVKLANILISPHFSNVTLIDWGCGTYVSDVMSTKAGSRSCRPPEMLLGYHQYGTGCDIWAVGALIFYILTYGQLPWKAKTAESALIRMSEFFPQKAFRKIARELDLPMYDEIKEDFFDEPGRKLEDCFYDSLADLCDPDLIDLMKYLMTVDFKHRPTAQQALQHRFFQNQS